MSLYVYVSGQYGTPSVVDCYDERRMTNSERGGNIGLVIREVSATLTHKHRF